ncbi:MAG: D-alanyl-D-alanine carboxypeptidase/D-alanyl-D-alanine-endopeptidase [Actinomycetota bacterium]
MSRRARRPLAVLCVFAVLPAVGLGALALVAHSKAENKPASDPVTTDSTIPLPTLGAPLLSVRRAPAVLAADVRADLLKTAAAPLLGAIDAGSCAAIGLDDHVITTVHPDLAVIPASNLKVVVAAVALDVLGPAATFTTQIVGPAPVGGVITGDVYLVGGGDPVLSQAWYTQVTPTHKRPPLHVTSAESLADALVAAGVTTINGRLVGDGSRYDAETYPPGWGADIRGVADGAPVGALVLDDSISQAGVISKEPAAFAAKGFAALLKTKGVAISGGSTTGAAPPGLRVLASVKSAPLTDLVNEMLATSDNLTAEMLVKEIGKSVSGKASRVDGLAAITQRLAAWGVPTTGVQLTDGSGLSRDNLLTCATLMAVVIRGSATDALGAALARGGQAGSTLADYFGKAGLAGVVQGKTGSLKDVKSLSGYFVADGDEIEFVVILNGPSAAAFTSVWDKLGAALLAAAASPAAVGLAPVAVVS